ncbi:MAG: hypothetical protein HQ513_04660 [Rhodospirillales bacterium]|nr:hypothetical protein [Rhodospirillales bacterium]
MPKTKPTSKSPGLRNRLFKGIANLALRASGDTSLDIPGQNGLEAIGDRTTLNLESASGLERLKLAMKGQKDLNSGRIHVLDLTSLRQKMKDKWDRYSAKILKQAKFIIERNLRDGDIYFEVEGPTFLIVMVDLDEDKTDLRMAVISEEIRKRVVGVSSKVSSRGVIAGIANLAKEESVEDLDLSELAARAISRSGVHTHVTEQFAEDRKDAAKEAGRPEIQWRTKSRKTKRKPDPSASGENASDQQAGQAEEPKRNFKYIFRPMWNVRKEVVTTFRCLPVDVDNDGNLIAIRALAKGAPLTDYVALDVQTVQRASAELERLEAAGLKLLISFPIHYVSLAAPLHIELPLRNAIQNIPEQRRSLLIPEFLGVPKGVPELRVAEVLASVHPMLQHGILNLPLRYDSLSFLKKLKIDAVSTDLSGTHLEEKNLFALLDHFAAAVSSMGLTSYAHGIRTLSLTSAAVSAGFDYVDGDAVISIADSPNHIYRFSLADLYSELL